MDLATLAGLLIGTMSVGYIMVDGGMLGILRDVSSFMFVFGGTFSSTLMTYPWKSFKKIPGALMLILFPPKFISSKDIITRMCELSRAAALRGIDALPEMIYEDDPAFIKTGLKILINNWSENDIRKYMNQEMDATVDRHSEVQKMFESMGSYAPIYGLLGTLIGVLGLLKHLGDPTAMGNSMSKAITTFYGIFFANFVALPAAGKLEAYSNQELLMKSLILEGIVSIKREDLPFVVRDKLEMIVEQSIRQA